MNTRSTQRVVGLVVAVVATALLLMALPSKESGSSGGSGAPAAHGSAQDHGTDARSVLPVFEEADGWWVLTRYGSRMRLPAGWTPMARRDRPFAFRDPEAAGRGSLNVLSLPNLRHPDLASVAEENRVSLEQNEHLSLLATREITLNGSERQALLIDYAGAPEGTDMRFTAAVFLLGGHQVVITAAARAEHWDEVAADLEASLRSIELLDLPSMTMDEQVGQ